MLNTGIQLFKRRTGTSDDDARIVYFLYLGTLIFPVLAIAGVVVAYVIRKYATDWAAEHYRFQIRTFWIGLLFIAVGAVSQIVVVGWFILVATLIWWIVRCVRGLNHLSRAEPHPNPESWLW